jgi:hypothetical protein
MSTDHVEPFITDGGKAVRCCRPDYHNVASAGTVWLAFELDCGDCTFPLIATMQDVEHSSSSRCLIFGCTPLGAMPEAQAEPE